jgi:hypothetical protein
VSGSTPRPSASRAAISVLCNPCSNGKPIPRSVARHSTAITSAERTGPPFGAASFITTRNYPNPGKDQQDTRSGTIWVLVAILTMTSTGWPHVLNSRSSSRHPYDSLSVPRTTCRSRAFE